MSIFYDRQQELEKYEFMMGEARGRLAVTLDALTDALILVGQHGVYCTSARNPTVPALDLQAVSSPAAARLTRLNIVVRLKSIASLSVQKSRSIVEFCTAAQIGIGRIRSANLGGCLI